jgi:hypothetical protein
VVEDVVPLGVVPDAVIVHHESTFRTVTLTPVQPASSLPPLLLLVPLLPVPLLPPLLLPPLLLVVPPHAAVHAVHVASLPSAAKQAADAEAKHEPASTPSGHAQSKALAHALLIEASCVAHELSTHVAHAELTPVLALGQFVRE